MRIGKISKLFSPGYSSCFRCLTTWRFVEGHTTHYNDSNACFPLCEKCWRELTPATRLPYYKQLSREWRYWEGLAPDAPKHNWEEIEKAVMQGK